MELLKYVSVQFDPLQGICLKVDMTNHDAETAIFVRQTN